MDAGRAFELTMRFVASELGFTWVRRHRVGGQEQRPDTGKSPAGGRRGLQRREGGSVAEGRVGAMAGGRIELVALTKRFTDIAVDRVDLTVDSGEFFSLLGPRGCGKTTTLRLIAGFEQPTERHASCSTASI